MPAQVGIQSPCPSPPGFSLAREYERSSALAVYVSNGHLAGTRTGAVAENISDQLIALTRADIGTCEEERGGGMHPHVKGMRHGEGRSLDKCTFVHIHSAAESARRVPCKSRDGVLTTLSRTPPVQGAAMRLPAGTIWVTQGTLLGLYVVWWESDRSLGILADTDPGQR